MKQAKRIAPFLIFCVAALLLTGGCGSGDSGTSVASGDSGASSREPIIVSLPADVTKLDPPAVSNSESLLVVRHLYDRLTEFRDSHEVEVVPALAESWDVSEDGLRYTFHLRGDATFSNGAPVTADAVQFSLQRIYDENHEAHWNSVWKEDVLGSWFSHFEIIDDRTIVLVLEEPYVALLANLAMPCASILNPDHVLAMGRDRVVTDPLGSGPYILEEWKTGNYLRLKSRDDHWRGKPATDTLIFRTQKDMNQRMASLRKGDVHLVTTLSPGVVGDRDTLENCKVVDVPMPALNYVIINCDKEKLRDHRVRLALNYAIDREALCEGILEGSGFPAGGIIPPGMLGYREEKPHGFSYDPDRARALLEEADAVGLKLEYMCFPEARPYNIAGMKTAQRVQEDLRRVGVETELVQRDFGGHLEILSLRTEHELAGIGWMSDTGDPDNFIYVLFGTSTNRCNYENEEANRYMKLARSESDPVKRAELYHRAEDSVLADPPCIFLNHATRLKGHSTRLKGYNPYAWSMDALWNAYLE